MLSIAWQLLKARKAAFIGAFLAVLCGTAVVAGCGILMESGIRSGVPTERYAAATVVVGGGQVVRPEGAAAPLSSQNVGTLPTVPDTLVGKVSAVPGVAKAVGESTFPARVVTGGVFDALGHNWDSAVLTPFTLRDGREPASGDEVVLDAELAERAGVAVGGRVEVMTTSTPTGYDVVGIAAPAQGVTKQSGLYFTAAQADLLSGRPGRFHAIGVFAEQGVTDLAERVEQALAGEDVTVAEGKDRGTVEFAAVGESRTMLMAISGSFGGIAMMVAVFVVAGTLALSVEQRRRELALLRAIAATPRQIGKLIGAETTMVAALAAALGSVAGIFVGHGLRDAFAAIGVIPHEFALSVGPLPLLVAFLLGLGVARLAAWVASRRPSRIPPTEALGEAAVERPDPGRWRGVAGAVFLLLAAVMATMPLFLDGEVAIVMASTSVLVAVIGMSFLGARAVAPIVRLAAVPLRKFGATGFLAAANSQANLKRVAAALTPLMLSISFALVSFFSQTVTTAAGERETELATAADYVVSAPGGVSPEVAEAARGVDGVEAAASVVRTRVMAEVQDGESTRIERVPALGLDDSRGALDLGVLSGNLADLRGDTIALSKSEANWLDARIGDEVELFLDDGRPVKLRLVATFDRDLAFGKHVLPAELARAHSAARLDSSALVRLTPDADRAAVAGALAELAGRYPGTTVTDRSAMAPAENSDRRVQFWVNLVAVGVILGYIAISVANTLVLTTVQRRREFALLRLVGGTRRQVLRMMRAEALTLVGIAIAVGTLIPAIPLVLLSSGLMGTPLPTGPIGVYLAIIGFAALLGLLALGLPTRLALRARPIDAIGMRE
ncbi:putative ABC transport system permease protein [Saccharothrix tamanrassetensis]|uniref:Putative ABC transport system permease protein n=1 Tax=Saccharothrix tamanrassetensis TaxID=1051531 RepID=A0A841CBM4_9PSEU|nr:FtsX-like permease family protein [Saccharothrix tamanrassetensis]MBB5955912.1 putative ABC transport system permease protein [Saccharothrix tamanrassetensis]